MGDILPDISNGAVAINHHNFSSVSKNVNRHATVFDAVSCLLQVC